MGPVHEQTHCVCRKRAPFHCPPTISTAALCTPSFPCLLRAVLIATRCFFGVSSLALFRDALLATPPLPCFCCFRHQPVHPGRAEVTETAKETLGQQVSLIWPVTRQPHCVCELQSLCFSPRSCTGSETLLPRPLAGLACCCCPVGGIPCEGRHPHRHRPHASDPPLHTAQQLGAQQKVPHVIDIGVQGSVVHSPGVVWYRYQSRHWGAL